MADDDLDLDGYLLAADCDDANPAINPAACDIKSDGIDQDCDGADRTKGKPCPGGGTCTPTPGEELFELTCSDGIDNDCDGLSDCSDTADCGGTPACQPVDCSQFTDKGSCGDEPACKWSNKAKACNNR